MEIPEADRSICTTCRHASGCGYTKNPTHRVFFCNEYEADATAPARAGEAADLLPAAVAEDGEAGKEESAKLLGLCQDCGSRGTCTSQRPEGGVWHCAEYQ